MREAALNLFLDLRRTGLVGGLVCSWLLLAAGPVFAGGPWSFTDVTTAAGFNYTHGFVTGLTSEPRMMAPGVAAADYDGDGWADLYAVRGDVGPNLLFRNLGNGTFQEVGAAAGLNITGEEQTGVAWGDIDGDGWLDLILSGLEQLTAPMVFRNLGNGTFQNVTVASGINVGRFTFSSAFGDYDKDGDLDVLLTFWNRGPGSDARTQMWRNNGAGVFTDVSRAVFGDNTMLRSNNFTPNFSDVDNDGDADMLMAADFGTSWWAKNNGNGTFTEATTAVISDENGMGATVGDYDNDGDLDWFVSSIWDPDGVADGNWGLTGNRLYRNDGMGGFEDATDEAGVREGYWGWGSCFADFNNDGYLDLFHVNGWPSFPINGAGEEFFLDPSRLFVANGDGTFTEMSSQLGINDTRQGRGVVCFDYDRDGDLDIFISNNMDAPRLYRNNNGNNGNFLAFKLRSSGSNRFAVHARVHVTAGGVTQMRELNGGSSFLSHDPPGEVHFGLGSATRADLVTVTWPNGTTTTLQSVAANQFLNLTQGATVPYVFADGFESGDLSAWTVVQGKAPVAARD